MTIEHLVALVFKVTKKRQASIDLRWTIPLSKQTDKVGSRRNGSVCTKEEIYYVVV